MDEWLSDRFPTGGFHVDARSRTVDFWTAHVTAEIRNRVSRRWPDWEVHWHRDAYESQLDLTDGRLRFPARSEQALKPQVADMLLRDLSQLSAGCTLGRLPAEQRMAGKEVQINPWALRDDRLDIPMDERRRIVAARWAAGTAVEVAIRWPIHDLGRRV